MASQNLVHAKGNILIRADRGLGEARASDGGLRTATALGRRLLRACWGAPNPAASRRTRCIAARSRWAELRLILRAFRAGCWWPRPRLSPTPTAAICAVVDRMSLAPIGANRRARGSQRPCLGILAKCSGLIAQEAPPRLGWLSARCRQITRDGGLGNGVSKHEKLTVDPRRTPEKVLPAHLSDQIAQLTGDPRTPTSPATR